jgi:sialate O-acetylesterase
MKTKLISKITTAFLLMLAYTAMANVELPNILSSNMVIQRDTNTKIWGTANAREEVSVTFRGETAKTKADKNGAWHVSVATGKAGGPFEIIIEGNNTIKLENILVGDVWVCSGQSNMEWPLIQTNRGFEEVANANYPNIRLFKVEKNAAPEPVSETHPANWKVCSPQSVEEFSAVGFHFGKNIHLETGVPVGLISSNWCGTIIETWMSEEMAKTDPIMDEWLSGLKDFDLEKMAKEQKRIFKAYHEELEKAQKPDYAHQYITTGFDDSGWDEFEQPMVWESYPGYENFDGVVWFRKTFEIPAGFNTENATISLARIDDTDITWLNEKRIGETYNQYNLLRKYEVPASTLKKGTNHLSIRVEDYSGGGGFHGAPSDMYISDGTNIVKLAGNWKIEKDATPVPKNPTTAEASALNPNQFPTLLFNGMINPILNFAVKGAIWYQGESNANAVEQAKRYDKQMRMLITDWRENWGNPELSFYMVQLANFKAETTTPQNEVWPYLREAQAAVAKDQGVEMACIIDIGDADDIHPRNKTDVGYRLALNALKLDYGKNIVHNGPRYSGSIIEGNKAVIQFDTMGSDLTTSNKYGYVNGFAVAGPDKVFYYAKASLKSNTEIVVESSEVEKIESVRFLWADNPGEINLYNSTGLPAEPFRTDSW